MEHSVSGKVWKFGDNIDTDIIMPSQHLSLAMDEMYKYAFEPLAPGFYKNVSPGDIIVAGLNFGSGSSREQAPQAILRLGIPIVIAKSFARIFYRNALNIGLYAIESHEAYELTDEGDEIDVLLDEGVIRNRTKGKTLEFRPFPDHLREIIVKGGLVKYMKQRNEAGKAE